MASVESLLCPDPPRRVPAQRLLGVVLRTAHLLAVGTLLGGHVFDVAPDRLVPFLAAAIVTGAAMITLELASTCAWLFMGKGLAVALKLGLLLLVPVFWDQRVLLLVAVMVVAGFGSHMSARFRHCSLLARHATEPLPRAAAADPRALPARHATLGMIRTWAVDDRRAPTMSRTLTRRTRRQHRL